MCTSRAVRFRIHCMIACLLFLGSAAASWAGTYTWNNTTGNWDDASKWSGGVIPGPGDTAIVNGGSASVPSAVAVDRLQFGGGTLTGSADLTVTVQLDWTAGTMSGTGQTIVGPGAILAISGAGSKILNRTLLNGGQANWSNGTIGGDGFFHNQAGSTLTAQLTNNVRLNPSFGNDGRFVKTGSAEVAFGTYASRALTNSGSVAVQQGTLELHTGSSTGDITVAAGATLSMESGTFDVSGPLTGAGKVSLNNPFTVTGDYDISGETTVRGGTATFDDARTAAFGPLRHKSDVLNLAHPDATVSGNMTRLAGTFEAGRGTVTFTGTSQTLVLETPTTFHSVGVTTGTFLLEVVVDENALVGGAVTNYGTIRKTRSTVTASPIRFGLTGVAVSIQTTGTLSNIQVDRIGGNHPNATTQTATGQHWRITPLDAGYTVSLTLPHTVVPHTRALVSRYTGTEWDSGRSASTANTVTRSGVTALSRSMPWGSRATWRACGDSGATSDGGSGIRQANAPRWFYDPERGGYVLRFICS